MYCKIPTHTCLLISFSVIELQYYNLFVARLMFNINNDSKDQESVQSSTTPDPGYQWESDKLTVIHHKREPRGQPFASR